MSLPRNDRIKLGFTFEEIISNNIDLITKGNDLVLYVDEVLSGSRFRKISTVLKKKINKTSITLLPCALVFKTPNFEWKPEYSKNKKIIRERSNEIFKELGFLPWLEMPELPKFKIDAGPPFVYESPVIWGEQPIVAGMKKVNFVFNIIEQFEAIFNDIISNECKSRDCLLSLWAKDTKGVTYSVPESILLDVFIDIRKTIDWHEIRELAKTEFPVDYSGRIDELRDEEVRLRWNWLISQVGTKLNAEKGRILSKALLDLFTVIERHFPQARDSNYCNYFFKYNQSVSKLNQKLIDLIMQFT